MNSTSKQTLAAGAFFLVLALLIVVGALTTTSPDVWREYAANWLYGGLLTICVLTLFAAGTFMRFKRRPMASGGLKASALLVSATPLLAGFPEHTPVFFLAAIVVWLFVLPPIENDLKRLSAGGGPPSSIG